MGTTKKQTAVEWLESKLKGDEIFNLDVVIAKAKEMEKEQIVEAVTYGQNNHTVSITSDIEISKQYYTETYETN